MYTYKHIYNSVEYIQGMIAPDGKICPIRRSGDCLSVSLGAVTASIIYLLETLLCNIVHKALKVKYKAYVGLYSEFNNASINNICRASWSRVKRGRPNNLIYRLANIGPWVWTRAYHVWFFRIYVTKINCKFTMSFLMKQFNDECQVPNVPVCILIVKAYV